MKKKILSVLSAFMLCLSVSACADGAGRNDINNTDGILNSSGSLSETDGETADGINEETLPAQTVAAKVTSAVESRTAEITSEGVPDSSAQGSAPAQTTPVQAAVTVPAVTEAPVPEWTETAVSAVMYVNTNGVYSRMYAVQGSTRVKQYSLNQAVNVAAKTDTGYYKLKDGEYIHGDYLSTGKVTAAASTPKPAASTANPPAVTTAAQGTSGGNGQRAQTQEEISFADRVFELVNAERTNRGLAPFKKTDTLTEVANLRAWELAEVFGHKRPNGKGFSDAFVEKGLAYSYVGENIAGGQTTPEDVVGAWMNSDVHRANILDKDITYMGVGFYKLPGTQYTYYWSQSFYIPL